MSGEFWLGFGGLAIGAGAVGMSLLQEMRLRRTERKLAALSVFLLRSAGEVHHHLGRIMNQAVALKCQDPAVVNEACWTTFRLSTALLRQCATTYHVSIGSTSDRDFEYLLRKDGPLSCFDEARKALREMRAEPPKEWAPADDQV